MVYLCTRERRARASGIGDGEGVLGEGVQDTTGVVEEFEGLVTSVDDGRGDLEVLQPIDIEVGGPGPDGQARGGGYGKDTGGYGDEGDERSTEGRE